MKDFFIFIGIPVLALILILVGLNVWTQSANQTYCYQWGQETGRKVKFIRPSFWFSDCLVETKDGYISGANLQVIETPSIN